MTLDNFHTEEMMFNSCKPALLIVDVQQAIDCFSPYKRNNPSAEEKIASLLARWRHASLPVVHVRHSSKFLDSPYHQCSAGFPFKQSVAPIGDELVVTKSENCAFINTDLEQILSEQEISEIIICGVLCNNSIDATVRVASGLGFHVYLPHDTTAAFPIQTLNGKQFSGEDIHWIFISNLDKEYCRVCSSEQILDACRKLPKLNSSDLFSSLK